MDYGPTVSIVVPTFRNPETLIQTLRSFRQLRYPTDRYEVVIVDDGGEAGTAAALEAAAPELPAFRYVTQIPSGAARARNHGADVAGGEILVFVDDDMLVPSDLLERHVAALERHRHAVISGYREFAPELISRLRTTPFGRFRLAAESRQEWGDEHERALAANELFRPHPEGLPANNLAVRREEFLRLGGFDDSFPFAGYEDQEFTLRATEAGLTCLVNHGLLAWHNDRRLSLREFGERQRRGAMTAVLLASKHPNRYLNRALFRENGPIEAGDPVLLIGKKVAKRIFVTRVGLAMLFAAVAALERFASGSRALQRLYTVTTGVYTFAGIQDGRRRYLSSSAGT